MNNVSQVDSSQVDKLLSTLDNEALRATIINAALKGGAEVIQQKAQQNFRSSIKGASNYSKFIRKPFYQGVKTIVDKGLMTAIVSIMSDYRMKFFEKQIQERSYKKNNKIHRTGVVSAKHFFKNAITQTQSQVEETIKKIIDNKLQQIK